MDNSELRRTAREAFRQMDEGRRHLTIDQIAAFIKGELPVAHRAEAERHLAECAECRERREEFASFLADSNEAPETGLEEEWRALRRRIGRGRVIAMPRWAGIAAAVFAVCGLSYTGYRILAPTPARLLAQAYREQRSFEFRIAGAGYAPIRQERGGTSAFGQSLSLLKAQTRLAEELKNSPEDPQALRLKGEAEMIAGDAASAVQTLLRANDLLSQNAAILADLGSAYALLGDAERRPEHYVAAVDYLGRSIRLSRNPEAMFNCALALEKALFYDRALEQWEEYLKADPTGEWSAEASRHRDEIRPKVKSKEKALLLDPRPEAFLAAGESADAEAYLREAAVTEWLPQVGDSAAAKAATERLARLLASRHTDRWLVDLQASVAGPKTKAGLKRLSEARSLNQHGNGEGARAASREAQHALAGAPAGVVWARLEEVVSLRILLKNRECLDAAQRLAGDLDHRNYPWLSAETYAEAATCSVRLGDLDGSASHLRQAIQVSRAAHLGEIHLRTSNYALMQELGARSQVYVQAAESLRTFWAGAYPIYRYYQTADMLRQIASVAGLPDAALLFARSAVWSAMFQPDPSYQASASEYLAAAASAVGERRESEEHRKQADVLIAGVTGEKRFGYYLGPQTALAAGMMAGGDAEPALRLLESMREGMALNHSSRGDIRYFSLLGEAHRRKGLLGQAVHEFQRSIESGRIEVQSVRTRTEKVSVVQMMAESYRGLVAAKLAQPDGASEGLRIWRSYRALDAPLGTGMSGMNGANGTMLIFAQLPEGFAGWLVRGQKTTYRRLSFSPEDAGTVAARFLRALSDPRSSTLAVERDARQLYDWLIEPFEADIKDRTLVVELDGILAAVPMQALKARDGRYLCERFSVLLSPGYETARSAPIDARSRLLAVANPAVLGESAARFPPLPDSLKEAGVARSAFPSATLVEGREATVDALAGGLRSADIVLFAGHGYAGPGGAALLFAPKPESRADCDRLRAEDLAHEDWSRCRLAVLSACAAASGESRGGHNPESLVRALLHAGASRVAASLWSIDSAATSALMGAFYSSLAKGETPAEALDSARAVVRQRAEWAHPYYWAGFQLYGTS